MMIQQGENLGIKELNVPCFRLAKTASRLPNNGLRNDTASLEQQFFRVMV